MLANCCKPRCTSDSNGEKQTHVIFQLIADIDRRGRDCAPFYSTKAANWRVCFRSIHTSRNLAYVSHMFKLSLSNSIPSYAGSRERHFFQTSESCVKLIEFFPAASTLGMHSLIDLTHKKERQLMQICFRLRLLGLWAWFVTRHQAGYFNTHFKFSVYGCAMFVWNGKIKRTNELLFHCFVGHQLDRKNWDCFCGLM